MNTEILKKTLIQMPECFTSHEFVDQAKNNEYPERFVRNGKVVEFLKRNCRHEGPRSKTWYKISDQNDLLSEDQEAEAIKLLKSKGYKIMKPVNEFQEV